MKLQRHALAREVGAGFRTSLQWYPYAGKSARLNHLGICAVGEEENMRIWPERVDFLCDEKKTLDMSEPHAVDGVEEQPHFTCREWQALLSVTVAEAL